MTSGFVAMLEIFTGSDMSESPVQNAEQESEADPLARFRNWHGFLWAAVAVNVLFVYGMLGNMADPSVRTWFKALVWLPFNAIATAVYFMLAAKLRQSGAATFHRLLCLVLAVANWAVMVAAGH
jgi:hypothetical protein